MVTHGRGVAPFCISNLDAVAALAQSRRHSMKRRHISEEQLLAEIGKNVGPSARRIASRLLDFADEIGAEKVGRHNSISIRFRLLGRAEAQWLTLFVITTAGT